MNTIGRPSSVLLRRGSLVRIEALPGNRVSCIRGMVWLTQEHDPTDRIVCAGETFVIDRPGVVLVNALADDAVLEYPDAGRCTIVGPAAAGGRSALSLAAEIGRLSARVDPHILRALPAGARREVAEREALRLRRQVEWLVFQHSKHWLREFPARVLAGASELLARARRMLAQRFGRSSAPARRAT